MSKGKNRRWTEAYAREVLERAERRGQSDSALARELGVSPQRVWWWRKRLRREAESPVPDFVEVTVTGRAQSHPFVIATRSGRSVAVWPGFDGQELNRLLATVEQEDGPC